MSHQPPPDDSAARGDGAVVQPGVGSAGQAPPKSAAPPTPSTLASDGSEEGILQARVFLASGHRAIDAARETGAPPQEIVRTRAQLYDQLLALLFDRTHEQVTARLGTADTRLALCAVGGYGRAELSPASDLDLLFLYPHDSSPYVEAMSEHILYRLWDLGLQVGSAVRSIAACIRLARTDLSAYTSLLDHRFLAGDRSLYAEFDDHLFRSVFAHGVTPFLEMRKREDERRRARYAGSIYLLEPNIKQGEGGLRDLHMAMWAARVRFRVTGVEGLLRIGAVSERDAQELTEAHEFLLLVREHLHRLAHRKEDRLTFEYQSQIAAALGYVDTPAALAVETFMQRYYRAASAIRRLGGRILERCASGQRRVPPRSQPAGPHFRLFAGALSVLREDLFHTRPSAMLELCAESVRRNVPLLPFAKDLVADNLTRVDDAVRRDPEAAAWFLEMLTDPNERRGILAEMHDLGLLGAYLPEFARVAGKHQHTLYHVFTVDVHTLTALERLKALHRGELAEEEPHLTAAMRSVERPRPLYLGVLFHDVGKGSGRDHSLAGAQMAREACQRMGLTPDEIDEVEFLVFRHLHMVKLATRRDMHDAALLERFCAEVGDEERLAKLYVLTYVDSVTTGPNVWSSWKASLVRELYEHARAHFRGEATRERTVSTLADERRAAARDALAAVFPDAADAEAFLESLPDRYFAATSDGDVVRHYDLLRARPTGAPFALRRRDAPGAGYTEVVLACPDRPGLLALVAGAFAQSGIDILAARIFTRKNGEALDVFYVRSLDRGRSDRAFARFEDDLRALFAGETTVEALTAQRAEARMPAKVVPRVPTRVEIDNLASASCSVVDVLTEDRPGLLYLMTRTLFELGLTIELSKITTEANRAIDAFYVRDVHEGKLLDAERIAEIKERLQAVLGGAPVTTPPTSTPKAAG